MISNIVLSLWQLGDYEYAEELFNNHVNKNKIDPLISSFINTYKTDPKIDEKRTKYQDLNQKGIKFYKKEKYEMALDFFNEALKKSPSNTNATINKAQALLKLASSVSTPENKRKTYIAECKDMLFILKSMFLSPNLVKRVDAINDELTTLLQPSFSRRKIRNNEGSTVSAFEARFLTAEASVAAGLASGFLSSVSMASSSAAVQMASKFPGRVSLTCAMAELPSMLIFSHSQTTRDVRILQPLLTSPLSP